MNDNSWFILGAVLGAPFGIIIMAGIRKVFGEGTFVAAGLLLTVVLVALTVYGWLVL